jgi:CRP-like cAMP-binding protein
MKGTAREERPVSAFSHLETGMSQSTYRNKLIRCLAPHDFDALRAHLEPVSLKSRQMLVQRNAIVPYIYFLESGQFSVLAKVAGSEPIEVAMIGREGMSDLAPFNRVPLETIVQVGGDAHRVNRETFVTLAKQSATLAELTDRWQYALLVQTSFTALSNGSFTVLERLARHLLMIHDRSDGDELPLVHEHFAWMLAVRRAGVTEAFKVLKDIGAVASRRGMAQVFDRAALVEAAHGSYGAAEAEYQKLFGYAISKDVLREEE